MNILMLAPQPFYTERGTPMNVRLMCRILGEAGHQVDLLTFPTGSEITLQNVRIIKVPNILGVKGIPVGFSLIKIIYDVLMFFYVTTLCIRKRYQVIHGIEEGGFLAVIFAKIFRTRSIFDMDSSMSEQFAQHKIFKHSCTPAIISVLERWALRSTDLTVTVCEALSKKALSMAPGIEIVQIEDIPLQEEQPDQAVIHEVEQYLQTKGITDQPFILYTGNLEKYQGIDLLLEAWKTLANKYQQLTTNRLVIVGGAAEQIQRYQDICEQLDISQQVVFTGARPAKEMSVWMNKASGLVSPRSEGENTPLKIYTYMASGKPIIATAKKTHTQVLNDTVAILAAPVPLDFAEALAICLFEPQQAAIKGAAAAQLVEEKYSYPVFQKKLLDAYNSLQ
ncbi:MAG: glycosyltransferase [Desulfobulbaceae bacterium]|nr:glycosyltransferase [Desulfobulbaceae bacterium]